MFRTDFARKLRPISLMEKGFVKLKLFLMRGVSTHALQYHVKSTSQKTFPLVKYYIFGI